MPTFIDTGEEYLNAAHIISIDTIPGDETIWIRLETAGKQNSYQPPRPVKSERFFHGKEVKMADPRSPPQGDFARNVSKLWEMITNGS